MENLSYQQYRNGLAAELRRLRAYGKEGRETAVLVQEYESRSKEYQEAKATFLKEIQQQIKNKQLEIAKEAHEKRVQHMREIVADLPLEIVELPVYPNEQYEKSFFTKALLLKIKGTDMAYLVEDDLEGHSSQYGIKAGGEKIFFLCGCGCKGKLKTEFMECLNNQARKSGIEKIISRYMVDRYDMDNLPSPQLIEIEKMELDLFPAAVWTDLNLRELLPTGACSENKRKQYQEEWKKSELENKAREEKREKEAQEMKLLLAEILTLEEGFNQKEPEVLAKVEELLKQLKDVAFWKLDEQIRQKYCGSGKGSLSPTQAEVLQRLTSSVNILCLSAHQGDHSAFHLKANQQTINLNKNEAGEWCLEANSYLGWSEEGNYRRAEFSSSTEKYRVVGFRGGLDGSALVIIATPIDVKNYGGRDNSKTIELYTDFPFYQLLTTELERLILSKSTRKYLYTSEEIADKAKSEIANNNRQKKIWW